MAADATSAIRAQLIAAMERRAAALDGEARRTLEARLAELRVASTVVSDTHAAPSPAGPLRELLDHLADGVVPGRAAYPDIPALADFRQLWATLRAENQLQQSVAHVPTDAGPLNSTALASRAIALMRELSPTYLRSFLAYVDELSWLENLGGTGAATTASAATTRKRARRKPQA
ncbi:DUF2894 domain-containing protein [Frateuria sp. MAH-13]|uniref:DUF2894 domain-containing protein n=1 Tax=Frateuria flava TaxID=2821489 RepID=A0ABS4DI79_9GAMM|nr:DUF2894 domain-containing protein [Frateuria flava]MBP1472753.1 DUF2894 domain-containing protein [Frateuria flava]